MMTTETTTKEAPKAPSIHEQIGLAQRELQELAIEKEKLPGLIQEASRNADAIGLIQHRKRIDEIDLFIAAGNVRLTRLQLSVQELKLPELLSEKDRLGVVLNTAEQKVEETRQMHMEARSNYEFAHSKVSDCQVMIGEHRRRLDQLMSIVTPGPVVRMRARA